MQPVLWTKGVLLTPQHLQTQDRFLEDLVDFRLRALSSAPWGFSALQIDREALANGTLALSRGAGVLPDGLLFDMPGADAVPPPRTLEGLWEPDQDTLDVYLTVPEYRVSGHNVSAPDSDARARSTRYVADVTLKRDENSGLAEKPLQVARKNFRFLVEGESLDGNSILRIARLRRAASGEVEIDASVIPPTIAVGASDVLQGIVRRLVEILGAKSSALAGTRRQKNQSLADFSITDVASFWLLYTVNTYYPRLRHIRDAGHVHPVELYGAMAGLAGALTTFSATVHPSALPAYTHEDLGSCFSSLDATVRELLETVVPANAVALPMRQVQPAVYATALDQDKYLAAPQMYLAVRAENARADIITRVPALIKVAAADQIDHHIRQALPGLELIHVPNPPSAVPVKLDHEYFQLRRAGDPWEAIRRSRNLAAYVPADFSNPELELVVVLDPARR